MHQCRLLQWSPSDRPRQCRPKKYVTLLTGRLWCRCTSLGTLAEPPSAPFAFGLPHEWHHYLPSQRRSRGYQGRRDQALAKVPLGPVCSRRKLRLFLGITVRQSTCTHDMNYYHGLILITSITTWHSIPTTAGESILPAVRSEILQPPPPLSNPVPHIASPSPQSGPHAPFLVLGHLQTI